MAWMRSQMTSWRRSCAKLNALVKQRVIVFAGMQKSNGFDGEVALLLLTRCPFTPHWQRPMTAIGTHHCTAPISRVLI